MHVREMIAANWPQYSEIQHYPKDSVALIGKTHDEWGIFSNMCADPIQVQGVVFPTAEHFFQLMKLKDNHREIYAVKNVMTMKHKINANANLSHHRDDWSTMLVEALKLTLNMRYEQSERFREELQRTRDLGLNIAEKAHGNHFDSYSVLLQGDEYVGPNLLGRLLMELRDNGPFTCNLPDDALSFIETLK